jgi:excisionase family DNA binding protein
VPDIRLVQPSLTVADFARLHALNPRTVYRLVHAGEIESFRIGNSIRIPAGSTASVER